MKDRMMQSVEKLKSVLICFLLSIFSLVAEADSENLKIGSDVIEPREISYLEYSYAQMRSRQIQEPGYELSMKLNETDKTYSGKVIIQFKLAENNKSPVRIDFNGGEVQRMTVNGQLASWKKTQWFLLLPANQFQSGRNRVEIEFTHAYTIAGDGLHRYQDAKTGNVYLYSNFEPFNAHKMFPHFDQPDLKASFTLKVLAPKRWVVVSNTTESSNKMVGKQREWIFPATPKLSSYVFALHAGPYKIWKDKHGTMPLRLLSRAETAAYVDHKEWFAITKQAFQFFDHYFEYAYPFKKYDQLIVPDFNSGAMENVAAVTFNENYAPRSKKSWLQRLRTASVISHEMAHMWFGDLVTMDWWNGLWLNESFATYMSALQQSENSPFKNDSWNEFYLKMKQWGYQEDQKVTTHAIELPVANTEEAFTNFDGITYGKGASVLRQLAHFVGEENFRKGVANYLKKHAYANATLKDFMSEIEQASGKDLTKWTHDWLALPGVNSVTVEFACTASTDSAKQGAPIISQLRVLQSAAPQTPGLRQHKLDLGLVKMVEGKVIVSKVIPVQIDSAVNDIPQGLGADCPELIYPNYNDWGYVKVSLDNQSKQFLSKHISKLEPRLAMMLWQNLWDDVLDAKISIKDFIDFVSANLGEEKSDKQLSSNMERLVAASRYLNQMQAMGHNHEDELLAIETILRQRVEVAQAGSDMQRGLFELYLSVIRSPEYLAQARKVLTGEVQIKGLKVDQDLRWRILVILNQAAYEDYQSLTEAEAAKDISDTGRQMAILSEVIRPNEKIKEKWVNELMSPQSTLKFATQKVVLLGLFPAQQTLMRKPFEAQITASLPDLVSRMSDRMVIAYARSSLMPGDCTPEGAKQTAQLRDRYLQLSPSLKKVLSVNAQDEARCVAMMQLMEPITK